LYAFSKENWARPKDEVTALMMFLNIYLEKELPLMLDKGIRLNVMGEINDFPKKLQNRIHETVQKTAQIRTSISISPSVTADEGR
jgi:undecaprenyl diphosphate synthase